jgi:hypothetical protein
MSLNIFFMWGFLGAFAIDFQAFYEQINQPKFQMVGIPDYYTKVNFWLLQLIQAVIGGFLALAWAHTTPATNPLIAVGVGASWRILILRLGEFVAQKRISQFIEEKPDREEK